MSSSLVPAMALTLPVLLGTTREGNATRRVARFATDRVDAHPAAEAELYEAASLPFGNLERRVWEMDPRPDDVDAFVEAMDAADGFVLVTPEYNHGYPGALKNILDHLYNSWYRKAFAIVTTGGRSGGIRSDEQLRMVITGGLGGTVVPRSVNVSRPKDSFDAQGPVEDVEDWERRFDRLAQELVVYADAMTRVREELSD